MDPADLLFTWLLMFFVPGPLAKIYHIPILYQSHRSAAISWARMASEGYGSHKSGCQTMHIIPKAQRVFN